MNDPNGVPGQGRPFDQQLAGGIGPGEHAGFAAPPGFAPDAAPAGDGSQGLGFPANVLEQALQESVGTSEATPRLVDTLAGAQVWVPLPNGGSPQHPALDLPTIELEGASYVPVFSSEGQFRAVAGDMPHTVAPVPEFARGLPPEVGIAVNPEGEVGIPLPPSLVAELCHGPQAEQAAVADPSAAAEPRMGGRVQLWEPEPVTEPVDFLGAIAAEFQALPVVLSARRALASVENADPSLFIGLELDSWQPTDREEAMNALGRALGAVPAPWPVNMVLLDVAQDPVGDWMLEQVQPFYQRR